MRKRCNIRASSNHYPRTALRIHYQSGTYRVGDFQDHLVMLRGYAHSGDAGYFSSRRRRWCWLPNAERRAFQYSGRPRGWSSGM